MTDVFTLDKTYIANTYGRFPVEIVSGKGSLCYDREGKEYVDLGTGIGVTAFGYSDEEWVRAVTAQLNAFQHTSNLYYTEPCARLAELLCGMTGLKKVFFGNSGAEANECAIKVARKYAEDKGISGAKIITLRNSFHGRTLATLAATGQDVFHRSFLPLPEGFIYAESGNVEELNRLVEQNTVCAIMLECVQGEGGVIPVSAEYIREAERICREKDILLVIDEVQTGNGRTGKPYAYMHYGVTPDVVTTAKGLGGGLPIGACIMGERVKDTLVPSSHGSTYGGNPVCSAGAISVIERLDEELLAGVKRKGEYIVNALSGAKGVKSVSGLGLMLGIEVDGDAKEIVNECIERGVLLLTAKNKVRLLPALNIDDELLERAIDVLKEVIESKVQL